MAVSESMSQLSNLPFLESTYHVPPCREFGDALLACPVYVSSPTDRMSHAFVELALGGSSCRVDLALALVTSIATL